MPPIGAGDYDNRNPFSDFTVTVDGKKASFQTECRAYTDTQEVTASLKELGLPACEFKSIASLPKGIQERAVRAKIASDQNVYDELMYTYSISRKHHWKQTFPAKRRLRISHSYAPNLGYNSIGSPTSEWKALQLPEDTRCAVRGQSMRSEGEDQECYARLRAEGMSPGDLSASHLSYIVTSANTWKDGIEDFKLKVSGGKLIFVELDGVQTYDLGELEINKKRFKPTKELTVEFLGKGEPYRIPSLIPLKKEIDGPANCRAQPDGRTPFTDSRPEDGTPARTETILVSRELSKPGLQDSSKEPAILTDPLHPPRELIGQNLRLLVLSPKRLILLSMGFGG
jgi:hypothetical protein